MTSSLSTRPFFQHLDAQADSVWGSIQNKNFEAATAMLNEIAGNAVKHHSFRIANAAYRLRHELESPGRTDNAVNEHYSYLSLLIRTTAVLHPAD